MVTLRQPAPGKEIFDLAEADDLPPALLQHIQQGVTERGERKVAAVLGTHIMPRRADEGARDDAPHGVLAGQHIPRKLAHRVEFVERNDLLVSSYLEDAVSRGVEDGATGTYMLVTQLFYDLGTRSSLVAQHLAPNGLLKLLYHLARK